MHMTMTFVQEIPTPASGSLETVRGSLFIILEDVFWAILMCWDITSEALWQWCVSFPLQVA